MIKPKRANCANFNHGKSNPAVSFCPNCGQKFKSSAGASCSDEKHRTQRKDRYHYCCDCGRDLLK